MDKLERILGKYVLQLELWNNQVFGEYLPLEISLTILLGILTIIWFGFLAGAFKKKVTVAEIWIYPIKSCKGICLQSAVIRNRRDWINWTIASGCAAAVQHSDRAFEACAFSFAHSALQTISIGREPKWKKFLASPDPTELILEKIVAACPRETRFGAALHRYRFMMLSQKFSSS